MVGGQVGRPDVDVHVPEVTHHHYFISSLLKSLDKGSDSRWVEEVVGQLLHLSRPGGAPHQNLIRRNIKKLTVNVKAVQQNLTERMMAKRTCLSGLICSMIFLI